MTSQSKYTLRFVQKNGKEVTAQNLYIERKLNDVFKHSEAKI